MQISCIISNKSLDLDYEILCFQHLRWHGYLLSRQVFIKEFTNIVLILPGIISAGMGLKGFLLSRRFIDDGVTWVSMLISDVLGFPLAI